ncbi:MAG: PHP domain-containing protein [Deltaproteobacteria bacterium]|nr:PHP domain-containing protein [Deltaproteobacteria bacterium]
MNRVDLHSHSTVSDGSFPPEEVVKMAAEAGLSGLALTDHDNIGGVETALRAGKMNDILVIPGVEISAEFDRGTCHILGYFFDPTDETLRKKLAYLQQARAERNPKIAKKLQDLGIDITYEEVQAIAGSEQVGRPHFARILMNKGIVKDFNEAFERFLGKDKAAYVDKFRYSPEEAFEMIQAAGGVVVLAHPYTLNLSDDELTDLLEKWVALGLQGMEVFYPDHTEEMIERYSRIANAFGLIKTGGSDFHGNNKEGSVLGDCGPRGCPTTAVVEQLRQAGA